VNVHLFDFADSAWALVLRSATIYLVLLLGLRVFGKREVGQFTLFDLVFILLVANAVQPAMTGPDTSLGGGFVIIATLLFLNFTISRLRIRVPVLERLLEPRSVVVARDGRWLHDALKREGITDDEGMATLREHGVSSVEETTLVVLEADGSLSVVPKDRELHRGRRRKVRFVKRA
jgi:uncharacterized membrane protein YcaP (DUF421 family)